MNGILYGVSVGSGEPELITLKAVKIIDSCGILAVPRTGGENTLALDIVKKVCSTDNKEIVYLDFTMSRNEEVLKKSHRELALKLLPYLESGKNIAFISIGDISLYSTFWHIAGLIEEYGFKTQVCAGVTSFCAVSARIKRPLAIGKKPLIIMPYDCNNFDSLIKYDCTRVIMKNGNNLKRLKNLLEKAYAVSSCGMADEKVYNDIPKEAGYFTTVILEGKYHEPKKLRCGYTTGTCAAIASKAACEMLMTGKKIESERITVPKGVEISADILDIDIKNNNYVSCAVRKDSGDDPDITNNMLIYSKAEKIEYGIEITGGEGVGIVTRNGLDQPAGEYAINSTPREMIKREVKEITQKYNYKNGIKITISVPEGKKIAEKTYNPRIGIKDGISIIGTSGIVEPMSSKALIDTIRLEEHLLRTDGMENLLLTIGNYGENFLRERFSGVLEKSVKCSNFIGDALECAVEYNFKSVLIVGHAGKLVKLGAGIMNTHSSQADARMDVLTTCGAIAGADINTLKKIPECITTDEAFGIFDGAGVLKDVSKILIKKIKYYLDQKVRNTIETGVLVFSDKYGIIGMTENTENLIERINKEYNG